jgi:hypothetical protein
MAEARNPTEPLHVSSDDEVARRLAAIRKAALVECPTSDIDTMLAEIEQGYGTWFE